MSKLSGKFSYHFDRSCYDNKSTSAVISTLVVVITRVADSPIPAALNIVTSFTACVVANYEILRTIIELSLIWRSSKYLRFVFAGTEQ